MSNAQTNPDEGLSGMDPRRVTRRVRRWVSYDGENGSEGKREIFDSHTWEEEGKTPVRERIKPSTPAGWFLWSGVSILAVGILIWGLKFFPGAYRSPTTIITAVLLAGWPVMYVFGNHRAFARLREEFDWSALYYGTDLELRAGKIVGSTDGHPQFVPMKGLSYGGYNPSYLELRDVFPPSEVPKLRSKLHRAKKDGSGEVIDRLHKRTTRTVETDTIGKVMVTHTSDLVPDKHGVETDRFTKPPDLFDEEVGRQLTRELEHKAEIQIPALKQQMELLDARMRDKEALESELLESVMGPAQDMVEFLSIMRQTSGHGSDELVEPDHGDVDSRLEEARTNGSN